jgi:formylglycine-generating enzyme required for sulfatase activity
MKSKNYFSKFAVAMLFLVFGFNAKANNVEITGTSVSGSNVTFNISWENSWNASVAPANWDAVWVFVKYQDCNTRLWAHAGLSTVAGDHTAASPLQVDPVTDGRGVFVRRSALGGGNVSSTSITLKMTIPAGTYNYKVFGIEMVNVPQAAYELGDGISAGTFNSITINASSQSGGITAATIGGGGPTVPAAFPMGYNSFYCMKYEISQLQYVEFLNALTFAQQQNRILTDPTSASGTYVTFGSYAYRNGIVIETPGNNAAIPAVFGCDATNGVINNNNDGQNIAMNNLSWADLAAYLDWAALRPMTELEFEKVCRGTMPRVAGEYPWGDTNINAFYSTTVLNPFQPGEVANAAVNGRCAYGLASSSGNYGPLRVGLFATGTSGRSAAGASFYGAMEMGGNVLERTVTVGNATGVLYTGVLGDGALTSIGDANQTNWPSITTALGTGMRGGEYVSPLSYVRTSDRQSATSTQAVRAYTYGGRGVR